MPARPELTLSSGERWSPTSHTATLTQIEMVMVFDPAER